MERIEKDGMLHRPPSASSSSTPRTASCCRFGPILYLPAGYGGMYRILGYPDMGLSGGLSNRVPQGTTWTLPLLSYFPCMLPSVRGLVSACTLVSFCWGSNGRTAR